MDRALDKIFAHQTRSYSGIIVMWNVPNHNIERLAAQFGELVLKPTFSDALTSSSVILGLQHQGFNRTIEISQAAPGAQFVALDQDFDPPDEQGLQIKLDVNSKPQMDAPPKEAFSAAIPIFVRSLEKDLPLLITSELVAKLPK